MPKVAGNARLGRIAIWRPSISDAAPYFLVTNARFNLRDYLIELSGGVVDALLRDRNDSDGSPIAVFRDGNYPGLRGTFVDLKGKGLLYTRGSVPYYGTYPGLRVPRPLLLVPHENSDSALPKLAEEVLALTKVNWNTTQFDQKLPAPIKAAREVGRILKHIEYGVPTSPDFRKYT